VRLKRSTTASESPLRSDGGWNAFSGLRSPSASDTGRRQRGSSKAPSPLSGEREKLLRAYYADAIDVQILRREQARINAEVAEAESQLASDGDKLKQTKEIIDLALNLAKNCAVSYRKAKPRRAEDVEPGLIPHNAGPRRKNRAIRLRGALRVPSRFTQGLNGGLD
jgi:hypothetical protein